MPSDPNDELARFRARRDRERLPDLPGPIDEDHDSSEQQAAALARAREAWLLRRTTGPDTGTNDDGSTDGN